MEIPWIYEKEWVGNADFLLSNENFHHLIHVLRKKSGQTLVITNGKGIAGKYEFGEILKKNCIVFKIEDLPIYEDQNERKCILGVSLLKNNSRLEWLLEKSTELGISAIIPLICNRTEKVHFKALRAESIIISAMLQSQQAILPYLHPVVHLKDYFSNNNFQNADMRKMIATCSASQSDQLVFQLKNNNPCSLLIGPEGDFTQEEIEEAMHIGFTQISLGNRRLRTETAAIAAIAIIKSSR